MLQGLKKAIKSFFGIGEIKKLKRFNTETLMEAIESNDIGVV